MAIRCVSRTGSAVALHCCKAHERINRKTGNSTPCKIVTPKNFSWKFAHVITSETATTVQFFCENRFSGGFSPNRWNITPLWLVTARRYASAVLADSCHRMSVCLSVRLSVTSRSCTKMAKPRITLTTPYDSPETLVSRRQKSWPNSHDITPNGVAK